MKKKVTKVLACTMVLLVCLTGCGKTRSDKLAEAYEEEYGMSKEEARELAEYENEFYEEMRESEEQYLEEKENEAEFEEGIKLAEVKDEVKNAALTDNICQVYDAVIKTDGTMNLKEVFNLIQENTDFEVSINCNEGAVVNGAGYNKYEVTDEFNQTVCYIQTYNDTSSTNDAFNQPVVEVETAGFGIHKYNFFMASGIVEVFDKVEPYDSQEAEAYHQRIDEMGGEVRYDAIEEFLRTHGVTHIQKTKNEAYVFASFQTTPVVKIDGIEEKYKYIDWKITYDESTGNMNQIIPIMGIGTADNSIGITSVVPQLDEIDDEAKQAVIEAAIDNIDNDHVYGDEVSGVEFVGFAYDNESNLHEILKDDQDRYMVTSIWLSYKSNGNIEIGHAEPWFNETYSSIEEAITNLNLTIVE